MWDIIYNNRSLWNQKKEIIEKSNFGIFDDFKGFFADGFGKKKPSFNWAFFLF